MKGAFLVKLNLPKTLWVKFTLPTTFIIMKLAILPSFAFVILKKTQTILIDERSGLVYCCNTSFPQKYGQNMQFPLTDPVSPEIIIVQRDRRGKTCLSSQVVFTLTALSSYINITTFLVLSLFVSRSTYLISWHHHTTGGSNIAVTSPTFFLRSEESDGYVSYQSITADVMQEESEGEEITRAKTFTCQFLFWAGLTQETKKRYNWKTHQSGVILKQVWYLHVLCKR